MPMVTEVGSPERELFCCATFANAMSQRAETSFTQLSPSLFVGRVVWGESSHTCGRHRQQNDVRSSSSG